MLCAKSRFCSKQRMHFERDEGLIGLGDTRSGRIVHQSRVLEPVKFPRTSLSMSVA